MGTKCIEETTIEVCLFVVQCFKIRVSHNYGMLIWTGGCQNHFNSSVADEGSEALKDNRPYLL